MPERKTRADRIKDGPARLEARIPVPSLCLTLKLETKLMGGGVRPREIDATQWLRGTSVRGALRFWWRALYAHRYGSPRELLKTENSIFGAPASFDVHGRIVGGPGRLNVEVQDAVAEPSNIIHFTGRPGDPLTTAYFPSTVGGNFPLLKSASARLHLVWDGSDEDAAWLEVCEAAKAWLVFGGHGGRTRRAAGTLSVENQGNFWFKDRSSLVDWLGDVSKCPISPAAPANHHWLMGLFALHHTRMLAIGNDKTTAEAAQIDLLEKWKAARSQVKEGPPRKELRFRAAWGLPLKGFGDQSQRYASPVILSVVPLGPRIFVPLLLATTPHPPQSVGTVDEGWSNLLQSAVRNAFLGEKAPFTELKDIKLSKETR